MNNKEKNQTLEELLKEYGESGFYGFHMPGHKRNTRLLGTMLPYNMDITEIEGFDDLHHANGVLRQAQERGARLYCATKTYFLVNGSTAGNLTAIMSCTKPGGQILICRNCHKSVYNAVYLQGLTPIYLYPKFDRKTLLNGEVTAQDVSLHLAQHPDVQAVVIVSPTYDGVVSDIDAIAREVHQYHIPLIVDEAHGAHFGFHEYFPANSNVRGADIVIHSLHKTLPSLTQTALLHINGNLVDQRKIEKYLSIFQSSSPSYILMASMDSCLNLLEHRGKELFEIYVKRVEEARNSLKGLKHLKLIEMIHYDKSKFVISVHRTNLTSRELYQRLMTEYRLQLEMMAGTYVMAMTSIADTQEGFDRFVSAIKEIDCTLEDRSEDPYLFGELPRPEMVYTSTEMENIKEQNQDSNISSRYQYLYPPGIPIIVPGERMTEEVQRLLTAYGEAGFTIEES
ncbi:MAG: aminotransferase class I/II-fold pyridoxal phosphate-dependent enzyme [Lachnospiraceae bacterium]